VICEVVLGVVRKILSRGQMLGCPWRVLLFGSGFSVAGEIIMYGDDIVPP